MLTQTAVRTDQFRRFVPIPRNPPPPASHALDGAAVSANRSRNPCT